MSRDTHDNHNMSHLIHDFTSETSLLFVGKYTNTRFSFSAVTPGRTFYWPDALSVVQPTASKK